jgi:hypothetical protein
MPTTPEQIAERLRLVPEAWPLLERAAALPLWDAAYLLRSRVHQLSNTEVVAGLRVGPQPVDLSWPALPWGMHVDPESVLREKRGDNGDPTPARLKVVHPEASDGDISAALDASARLDREVSNWMAAGRDKAGDLISHVKQQCPGFTEETYRLAYNAMRLAYR